MKKTDMPSVFLQKKLFTSNFRANRPEIENGSNHKSSTKTFYQPKRIITPLEYSFAETNTNDVVVEAQQPTLQNLQTSTSMKFILVAFLIALLLPLVFRVGPLAFTGSRFFLALAVVPAISVVISRQRLQLADYFLLGYVVWATVCFLVNHEFGTAIQSAGSNFVEVAGAYFLGRMTLRYPSSYIFFSKLLLISIVLLLPFALLEAGTGDAIIIDTLGKFLPTFPDISMEKRLGIERVQAVFEHPILFGVFCASVYSPAVLVTARYSGRFKQTVFGLLVVVATFLSLATGAFLNVIWQILIVIWNKVFKKVRKRWLLLFALGVLAYVFVDALSNRNPVEVFISYFTFQLNSSYNRVLIWNYGTAELYRHPIFGIGLNDWVRAPWMGASFDNFWLLRAVRFGFPGFVFLVSAVLVVAKGITQRLDSSELDWRAVSLSQLCVLIGTCVSLMTVDLWSGSQTLFFFFLGAAASLNQTYLSETKNMRTV